MDIFLNITDVPDEGNIYSDEGNAYDSTHLGPGRHSHRPPSKTTGLDLSSLLLQVWCQRRKDMFLSGDLWPDSQRVPLC